MNSAAAAMTKKIGYIVSAAEFGSEALIHFQSTAYEFLLSSFEMPVMKGYQLARSIKMRHPMTKTVIMTGYCHAGLWLTAASTPGCINPSVSRC